MAGKKPAKVNSSNKVKQDDRPGKATLYIALVAADTLFQIIYWSVVLNTIEPVPATLEVAGIIKLEVAGILASVNIICDAEGGIVAFEPSY